MIIHFSQSKYQAVNLSLLSGSYFHPILLFVLLYTFFISSFLFFWQSIIDWKSLYHFTYITSIEYSLLFPISTPITVYSILHNSQPIYSNPRNNTSINAPGIIVICFWYFINNLHTYRIIFYWFCTILFIFQQNNATMFYKIRACLKKAFCKMCVTICGRFCPDEGAVAGYGNWIRVKYPAKWGVQIAGMIFQTHSSVLIYNCPMVC